MYNITYWSSIIAGIAYDKVQTVANTNAQLMK